MEDIPGKPFFAGASPRFDPHGGEVGQQSDSVSDRSCHHAARTGCTVHFENSKKHAHEAIPRAEERICSGCAESATYQCCFLRETRGVGVQMCSAKNHSKCNKRPDYTEEL